MEAKVNITSDTNTKIEAVYEKEGILNQFKGNYSVESVYSETINIAQHQLCALHSLKHSPKNRVFPRMERRSRNARIVNLFRQP